jgi:hypothetical protein
MAPAQVTDRHHADDGTVCSVLRQFNGSPDGLTSGDRPGAGAMEAGMTTGSAEGARGTTGPARSILVIGAIVVAIVVVAVLVVVLASRPPTTYPADSPEGTIQRYLAAVEAGEPEAAYAFFSRSVRTEMPLDSYRRAWADLAWEREQDRRVVLEQVDLRDTRATVHLRVDVYSGGGPFGPNRYTYERSVGLVRESGEWRIDEPLVGLEPVPYYD